MIAAYKHKETGKEVYVQDFTAKVMGNGFTTIETPIVIFREKGNSITFVMDREIFDKEFIKN